MAIHPTGHWHLIVNASECDGNFLQSEDLRYKENLFFSVIYKQRPELGLKFRHLVE
jgi:hypothetical protein